MAYKLPIEIDQGTTFKMRITLKTSQGASPINDYEFKGTIKQTIYDEEGFPFTFETDNTSEGSFFAIVEPKVSQGMDFTKGVYNIKYIASETEQWRLLEGPVQINLEV